MRNAIARIFICLGLLLILGAGGLTAYNMYDSWRANKASMEILNDIEKEKEEMTDQDGDGLDPNNGIPLYELYPDMEMPAVEIDGYRYIATLEIPSIDLKLPVMEEWDYTRLKISPCRYSGSAYSHDLVIAGHNYASHFSKIKGLSNGTLVLLTDMQGNVFRYVVGWLEVIEPTNVVDMTEKKENEHWDMTLFTCTTGGSARCAVRCVLE